MTGVITATLPALTGSVSGIMLVPGVSGTITATIPALTGTITAVSTVSGQFGTGGVPLWLGDYPVAVRIGDYPAMINW